jgi:hypothetical protein
VNPLFPSARLIHTVEAIGSNPIAPTIFKHLQAFQIWILGIWGHFSNVLDGASLRVAIRSIPNVCLSVRQADLS